MNIGVGDMPARPAGGRPERHTQANPRQVAVAARPIQPARGLRSLPVAIAASLAALCVSGCGWSPADSEVQVPAGAAAMAAASAASAQGPSEGGLAVGPITGFGSVKVGGIRFDDAFATVLDDEGTVRDLKALKLGMTVRVDSDLPRKDEGPTSATASSIRFGSALVGPVDEAQPQAQRFSVLGREVRIDSATVIDDRITGGRDGLRPGTWVEVYASARGADELVATRIEPAAADAVPKLSGHVTQVDAQGRTLGIDHQPFTYASEKSMPSLVVGQWVTVRLREVPAPTARTPVQSFASTLQPPANRDAVQIAGHVTNWTSPASFRVENTLVDASRAMYPDGTTAVHPNAKVVVAGALVNGVLQARSVRVDTGAPASSAAAAVVAAAGPKASASAAAVGPVFELAGPIESYDAERQRVQVRGEVVQLKRRDGAAVQWSRGAAADLVPGARVAIQAEPVATAGLQARRIEFN